MAADSPSIDTLDATGAAGNKLAGMQWVRAFAALAVVLLHASAPYAQHAMPGLVWSARQHESALADWVMWPIELMIMPLFLIIAGYFAYRSAKKQSGWGLVTSRAKRLLIPFAVAGTVLLTINLYVWTIGLVHDGIVSPRKLKSFKFDDELAGQIWGTGHLWFLLYVFLYVALLAAAKAFIQRRPQAPWSDRARLGQHWKRTLICLPVAAVICLAVAPEVVWGFQHSLFPVPSKWIYSGLFFAAGLALAHLDPGLEHLKRRGNRLTGLALAVIPGTILLGLWRLDAVSERSSLVILLALSTLTVASAALISFGVIGSAARYARSIPKSINYLAGGSFCLYLVHHPILGLIHLDLELVWPAGSASTKLAISFVAAVGISILIYEAAIRKTSFGRWLRLGQPHTATSKTATSKTASAPTILKVAEPEVPFGKPESRGEIASQKRAA
ncbi:MAG: hypothetical protein CBB71_11830 [Rhodopirellula sp. TMED11]|nr:MAG: hypothetical protein CBB71_11830 [Rhodopirellula sp. TMED11]